MKGLTIIQAFGLALVSLAMCAFTAGAQVLPFDQAKERADKGDAFAQAVVAMHYQLGWDTEKDVKQAARYAHASARANHSLGLFRLGVMLRNGEGFAKDEKKGLELQAASYKALKDAKDPYSITATAIMTFQGKVVGQNIDENERRRIAAGLYKQAADMGYAPAQFNYAMALNDGHGVSKDAVAARQYLRESLSAEYPPAQKFALEQAKSLSRDDEDASSAVEGVNSSGDRWAYGFSDSATQNSKQHRLESPMPQGIVFADDNYIVLKRLAYLGVGRYSTSLFIYDARSLLLNAVISVPNNVCAVDYSEERSQFLLLTISRSGEPWVKWPDDTGQALVLVDLHRRNIERAAVWRKNTDFYDFGGPDLAPRWDGNKIVLDKSKFPPKSSNFLEDMRFAKSGFGDVRVEVGQLEASEQAASANDMLLQKAGFRDNKRFLIPTTAEVRVKGDDSPFFGISRSNVNEEKLSMLVPFQSGKLVSVSLAALTSRVLTPSLGAIDGVGVFEDGGSYVRSGSRVVVYPVNHPECSVNADNLSVSSRTSTSGKRLYFASYHSEKEPAFHMNSVSSDGQVSDEVVAISDDAKPDRCFQKNEHSPKMYDFSIDGSRESISLITEGERSEKLAKGFGVSLGSSEFVMGVWWEIEWRTGKLLEAPYQDESARGMFGAAARFYGQAPPGWSIVSQEDSTSSGSENTVSLKQIGTKNEVVVGTSPYALRGGKPLVALDGDNESMLVISGGHRGAQVERVSLSGSNVTKIAQYLWDDNQGDGAFFVSGRNWLVVPQEGGWKIVKANVSNFSCETLAEVYVGSGENYAILLPSGSYAGSPGCESLLRLKAGDGSVEGSSVAPWRNRPAEVLKALGGDPEVIELLAKVTERWQKRIGFDPAKPEPKASDLPKVSVPERPPLWAKGQEAVFTIRWEKSASPLKDIIVRVNGVESARFEGDTLPAATEDKGSLEATVKLAGGQNWIEVTAEDVEGRRSDLQRFRTILNDSPTETKRYIVALGVSDYSKPELNLQFATKDAKDLTEALGGRGPDEVLLLTNDQVNRSAVEKIREFVGNSAESDEVILFCAGHGVLDDKLDYYFAGHDFDPDRPAETGIRLDDLVGAVSSAKALKRLVLLDTCHAGVVGEKDEMLLAQMDTKLPSGVRAVAQRGMKVQQAADFTASDKQRFIEEMFSLPGTIRGVNIIGASAGAQFALESDKWNNGVFTASVIEGLRDKKADWNEDGRITVSELKNYLGQRVSELTAGVQRPSVVAFEQDQDFNLLN